MATAFEPRSSFRASQAAAAPPTTTSTADALPDVDFGFEDLRKRMAAFTGRFDEFIAEGRKTVLAERNAHRSHLAELQEDQQLKQRSIGILQHQATTHASNLQKEAAETAEMNAAIAELAASRDGHAARNAALAQQASAAREAVEARLAAQRAYADVVAGQAARNAPELAFYEDYLGLRIESPADDAIAFVFAALDDRDPAAEFEVLLDLARRDYAVKRCRPALADADVRRALDRLNETRDLAPFLKDIRGLFQAKVREDRA